MFNWSYLQTDRRATDRLRQKTYTTFSNILKSIYKFEHYKLINESGKILHNTNFFYMINFSISYVLNNLFGGQQDDSEEEEKDDDADAGLSSRNKKQKTE